MNTKFGINWYSDVLPNDGYSLRLVKGKEDTGEVSVSAASIKRVGGVEECAKRLVAVWLAMPEYYHRVGWNWYAEGSEFARALGETYGFSVWQIAQVVSVLSPQNPWNGKVSKTGKLIQDGNRLCTIKVVEAFVRGGAAEVYKLKGWGYARMFTDKAIAVLEGKDLDWSAAPKTHRFALLLGNPTLDKVAVCDSHASRIATGNLGGRYHVVQKAAYVLLERAYVLASEVLGIPTYVLQAGTWQFAVDGNIYND